MLEFGYTLLKWMGENEKLAGWAQFAGAMLAVLIAIWVPWYQARRAERSVRAARIEHALANVQGVFFLLTDVSLWLSAAAGREKMPRKFFRDPFEAADLLERIRLWESRDESDERVQALFLARVAVLRTQDALNLSFMGDDPIAEDERKLIKTQIGRMGDALSNLDKQRNNLRLDRMLNQTVWFMRPFARLGWHISMRRAGRQPRFNVAVQDDASPAEGNRVTPST